MENVIGMKIKYSSPAVPPEGINLNTIYIIGFDKKMYITNGNLVKYMDLEMIKMYFSPVDITWDELLKESFVKEDKTVKKIK